MAVTLVVAALVAAAAAAVASRTSKPGDDRWTEGQLGRAAESSLPRVRDPERVVTLAVGDGGPAIVNFWASWCVPCRREMPALQRAYARYGGRVTFLGVNHQDDRDAATAFLDETGATYPSGYDPAGDVARRYALVGLPTTVVIGAVASPAIAAGGQEDAGSTRGEEIFEAHCAMCHGADASGMMGMHPSLRGAMERLSREGVEVAIRNGRRTQPPMPAWEGRLTDGEIDDVIAYIASLPDGPRNFGPSGGDGMMMGDGDDGFGPLVMVLVVAGAVAGAGAGAWVLHRSATSPRRVLDRRYATGELSREEYLQRRTDLNRDQTG